MGAPLKPSRNCFPIDVHGEPRLATVSGLTAPFTYVLKVSELLFDDGLGGVENVCEDWEEFGYCRNRREYILVFTDSMVKISRF